VSDAAKQPQSVERLLRSWWGRVLLVGFIVVVISLGMTAPRFEFADQPDSPVTRWEFVRPELIRWSSWALVAWPITALARWILAKWGSWLLLFLIQIPMSAGVGYCFLELDHTLRPAPPARAANQGRAEGGADERPRRGQTRDRRTGAAQGREGNRPGRQGERFGRGRYDTDVNLQSPFWQFRWVLSMLIYWAIMIMVGGVRSFLDSRDKERLATDMELRAERLDVQLARAQLDSLTSQLNPHFLFNALHSVGGLVRAGQDQAALKTLAAIGELLRATLDHGDVEEVELCREMEIAERYLDIERIRLGERLEVELDLEPDVRGALVPTLMLLPLVENAVRHGISDLPEGGRVTVRAKRRGPALEVRVTDSGGGFPQSIIDQGAAPANPQRRSIGLENTNSRLLALYGTSQQFELTNLESGGAGVRLTIPYHEQPMQGDVDA
jgi:two-component sensor histidine kinase